MSKLLVNKARLRTNNLWPSCQSLTKVCLCYTPVRCQCWWQCQPSAQNTDGKLSWQVLYSYSISLVGACRFFGVFRALASPNYRLQAPSLWAGRLAWRSLQHTARAHGRVATGAEFLGTLTYPSHELLLSELSLRSENHSAWHGSTWMGGMDFPAMGAQFYQGAGG